jgi:hypothetical protein
LQLGEKEEELVAQTRVADQKESSPSEEKEETAGK